VDFDRALRGRRIVRVANTTSNNPGDCLKRRRRLAY